jgi:20S proteasome subunit beta 4
MDFLAGEPAAPADRIRSPLLLFSLRAAPSHSAAAPAPHPHLAGIRGKDFVMVCSDTSAVQSVVRMKQDEDKLVPVDGSKLFAISGEAGDRVNFSEYVIANVRLYALRNGASLTTKAVANYTRGELATALRKSPYNTNLLMAGFDEGTGPALYWCDYLATLHHMNICGTGYGSMFVLSLFDKLWRADLTEADALEMMKKGIEEVKARLVVAPPKYLIKVIDKDGIRTLGDF